MPAATPRKSDGKVPAASKKGNPKSKEAGQKGAAKSAAMGYGKKKTTKKKAGE
jgi:hypothetical protein